MVQILYVKPYKLVIKIFYQQQYSMISFGGPNFFIMEFIEFFLSNQSVVPTMA
jgi:hypothetical protein